jgi:hypothetical protein
LGIGGLRMGEKMSDEMSYKNMIADVEGDKRYLWVLVVLIMVLMINSIFQVVKLTEVTSENREYLNVGNMRVSKKELEDFKVWAKEINRKMLEY